MKTRTDPKTMNTRAVLASADITAFAKVIDVLLTAANCDGEDGSALTVQAAELKTFVKEHQPKKDCDGQKHLLEKE